MTHRVLACLVVATAALADVLLSGRVSAQQQPPAVLSRLLWFDRAGTRLGGIGPVADHGNLELSPDGTRVAVAVARRGGDPRDMWLYDTSTGERTQFTRLALFEAPVNDGSTRTTLLADGDGKWPVSLSRDGRFLLYVTNSRDTSNDIWVMPLRERARPYPFLRSAASENWAAFSPDGKWVAFSSTEGGQAEVYVSAFPPNGRHWRISANGGSQARWRRDGKEIFYVAPDRTLMAVSVVAARREFAVHQYTPLFRLTYPYGAYHAFDVTADGQRFLVNTVVVNPASSIVATSGFPALTERP
jgi:WD40 repeat protein